MSGPQYLEDTYCRLRIDDKQSREAKIKMDFIAITAASKPWESPLSGFIGVGPYTMTSDVNK